VAHFVACPIPYASKPPPFVGSNARGFEGGATLRRQVQPRQLPPDMAVPTNVDFPIFDSRLGGYGIAQLQARERSLLGLPVLAATAPTGVLSFLEALPRPSALPLFELRGNPRSGYPGPDGDGVSTSSSFLKALSSLLAVSPVLVRVMLEFLLVRHCRSWFGLGRFCCDVSSVRAEHPLSLCSGHHAHVCVRSCHVLYPSVLILLLLSMK
jgi:hypothetical protein